MFAEAEAEEEDARVRPWKDDEEEALCTEDDDARARGVVGEKELGVVLLRLLLLVLSPDAAAAAVDVADGGRPWFEGLSNNSVIDTVVVRACPDSADSAAGAKDSSWPCSPSNRDGGAVWGSSSPAAAGAVDEAAALLSPDEVAAAAAAADLSSAARDSASRVESAAWPRASKRRPRC